MRSSASCLTATKKALRRFHRDRHGSAAVEFAFIAPLFFLLLFAIMETALIFFAGQVLETGTQDSARLMLTHQAQDANMSRADFEKDLCNRVSALFDCSKVVLSVRSYAPGIVIPSADLADPIVGGSFVNNSVYQTSKPGDTVLVRAFYQWPMVVTGLGYNIANIGSGTNSKRLLAATMAFRVEP